MEFKGDDASLDPLELRHRCRENFNGYLREALACLPEKELQRILDLGCGTGASVLAMARYTSGHITALEPDHPSLSRLRKKLQERGYSRRVNTLHCSLEDAPLPEKSFDLVLAEGLFNVIGFEKGLALSSPFVADRRYMIVQDELKDRERKLQQFREKGFRLIKSFELDEQVWWDAFYRCLEEAILALERNPAVSPGKNTIFQTEQAEIRMYREKPEEFRSVYYVVQKAAGDGG